MPVLSSGENRVLVSTLEVEMIMIPLMLVGRSRHSRAGSPPSSHVRARCGRSAILAASVYLWVVMTARERTRSAPSQPAQQHSAGLG